MDESSIRRSRSAVPPREPQVMGLYTRSTRRWLEQRYQRVDAAGLHLAHQPLFGRGAQGQPLAGHVHALARQYQILEVLGRYRVATLLDVGASEGLACHLARDLFGMVVVGCDLSAESCKRASEFLDVDQVACDSMRLPFGDGAFDAVICSEVLEHVEFPVETLLELARVARTVLIVTTDEVRSDRELVESHAAPFYPHIERNLFHFDDFRTMLGDDVTFLSQPKGLPPSSPLPDARVAEWIRGSLSDLSLHDQVGALILKVFDPGALRSTPIDPSHILERSLVVPCPPRPPARRRPELDDVLRFAVCPSTHRPLRREGDRLIAGERSYELDDGIPVLYDDAAPDPTVADTRRRLQEAWPSESRRVEAALAIRARLAAPEPTECVDFSFDDDSNRHGFVAIQQAEFEAGPGMTVICTGPDPALFAPAIVYPATGLLGLDLVLTAWPATEVPDSARAQVYWLGPSDVEFDEQRSRTIDVVRDGREHTYRIDLVTPPHLGVERLVFLFRLDPLDRPGVVRVRRLRFVLSDRPMS